MTTSCRCSARASEFPSPTPSCTTRLSIVLPTTAPKSATCKNGASNWAAICRNAKCAPSPSPPAGNRTSKSFYKGTEGRDVATTMVFVRLLGKLLRDPQIGKLIVPIIPDEARTFGMEALFRQVGIYSSVGQLYEPVDMDTLLYYKEAKDGQILEEGITEAGSMCSFIAAGTAYATHGINTIPFFIYYSMFGFQRIGDLIWAAADMRTRGFLIGGTAGRTTLAGEGLQHQDGHSHVLALAVPNILAYDPAFAYEIAVIIQDGIKRMYIDQESIFYYLTVTNEPLPMPEMPAGEDVRDGILRGLYRFKASEKKDTKLKAQLFGSGAIMYEVLKAQKILEEKYNVAADVWSVTSYKRLYREANHCDRWNMLHPGQPPQVSFREPVFERCERRVCGRVGQHEDSAGIDRPLGAGTAGRPGHGRLRPQRKPRFAAQFLRGGRQAHCAGHPERAGDRETDKPGRSPESSP